ncbi:uncharacterized protein B0T23DRAFT_420295 [Neurospora hispaniola]|uniref:Uncharacterized protein n=1 Tax=Neurospora hispaniola TaxID=588809 RepID=A0AAJ0I7X3_9PEZI|nr:hypothetical protein B0T23DRAFT_420295 [Neurospora hispaniola]
MSGRAPESFFNGCGIHIGQVFHSFTPLPSPPPKHDDALALCVTTQWYGYHVHEFHVHFSFQSHYPRERLEAPMYTNTYIMTEILAHGMMVGFNMTTTSWLARHAAARNLEAWIRKQQEDGEAWAGGSGAQAIWYTRH